MELSQIIPHIEALIFASDKPLTTHEIVELINNAFGFMDEQILLEQVQAAVDGIQEKYNAEFYPFEVRESGGGWQFLTKKEFHQTVGQLNGDKFLKRLSNAALETLAIIAYKQPITKGEVEAIRGVNSDYSVQKLLEKELVIISGRNENLPGKPLVYATSKAFMDYFGINNTNDLPKIKEVLAEQLIEATVVNSALNAHEDQAYQEANVDGKPKAQRELFGEGEEQKKSDDNIKESETENKNMEVPTYNFSTDEPLKNEAHSHDPSQIEQISEAHLQHLEQEIKDEAENVEQPENGDEEDPSHDPSQIEYISEAHVQDLEQEIKDEAENKEQPENGDDEDPSHEPSQIIQISEAHLQYLEQEIKVEAENKEQSENEEQPENGEEEDPLNS